MSQTTLFKSFCFTLFFGVLGFTSLTQLSAQNPSVLQTVSPYSRFGIGDFQMNGGIINSGMGGGGIGIRNDSLIPQYFNFSNSASLTSNKFVVYEIALMSNTVQLQNATDKAVFNRTTLSNFSLAFPVTKWWGAGFGLVPYSSVGYNVNTSDSIVGIGPVTYKYEGSGGVNEVFLSNGIRPFTSAPRNYLLSDKYSKLKLSGDTVAIQKQVGRRNALANISIGFQTSYLFGSLNNIRRDVFPDTAYTYNTKITKRTLFRDVYFNYGIQYSFRLKKSLNPKYINMNDSIVTGEKWCKNKFYYLNNGRTDTAALFVKKPGINISFGAIFSTPTKINVTNDWLGQTYRQIGTLESFKDTILDSLGYKSYVDIPAMFGFGIALKKDYKWMFQADYMMQMWSQAGEGGTSYGLKNSQRITAGFQYQPKQLGRGNYITAIQYRLGVKYFQTGLDIRNVMLNESSVNFGMSLPVPYRTKLGEPVSRATINFEYGMRGTTDQHLIKEDFFRVTFGFSINDRWFSHYKYD
ncbi:hypothetical protein BH09BAC5_BH09BAC5_06430 [soil metagenome]